ncbi:hypothetical protein PENSPDRAFT_653197 [Peniophora sp. CONT]|nr:hypothetical protein PENSPDRAFT_653197 [Peniophora sp. CONT]
MSDPYFNLHSQGGGPSFPVPSYSPGHLTQPLDSRYVQPQSTGFSSSEADFRSPGHGYSHGPSPGFFAPPMSYSSYPDRAAHYGPPHDSYPPWSGQPSGSHGPFPGSLSNSQRPTSSGYPPSSHGGYSFGPASHEYAPPDGSLPPLSFSQQRLEPSFQGFGGGRDEPAPGPSCSRHVPKRKAVCIGINYYHERRDSELLGCVNDAWNMQHFLITRCHYKEEDIIVLTDNQPNPRFIPTKRNMIHAMKWLVLDAQPGDSLFFHFSGHGVQRKDRNGDEADGWDEAVCPVDYGTKDVIIDDDMHRIMVKPLPPGCRLTAVFDCCHSGSALDLPYIHTTENEVTGLRLSRYDGRSFASVTGLIRRTIIGRRANKLARRTKTSLADVVSWAACTDSQTAADSVEAGRATGAMSHAFIEALNQGEQHSHRSLLVAIHGILGRDTRYANQKPLLSSSHPMDMDLPFII